MLPCGATAQADGYWCADQAGTLEDNPYPQDAFGYAAWRRGFKLWLLDNGIKI